MIYIITQQPFPNGMAGTNRIKCYARALYNAGANCKILIFSQDASNTVASGEVDGVKYHHIFNFPKRWPGVFGRLQSSLMMVGLYLYLLFRLKKGDVVFEYAREKYKYINAIIDVVHFRKAKFVSELCEIPGLGFKHEAAIKEKEYITKKLFPKYDGVIAISDSLVKYAKQYTSSYCKIIKVPILVDVEEFKDTQERPIKEPYLFYSGSFDDQKDGTIGMFNAFRIVAHKYNKPFSVVCTGIRDEAIKTGYLADMVNDRELSTRLQFTGHLKHDQIIHYLMHCEMVVSFRYSNEQTLNGFSTKLGEYAAAGKALVLSPVGESANWFHDGVDCVMVSEHNNQSLAEAIIRLFNEKKEQERIGNNIRAMCLRSFDYHAWALPLKEYIESL